MKTNVILKKKVIRTPQQKAKKKYENKYDSNTKGIERPLAKT